MSEKKAEEPRIQWGPAPLGTPRSRKLLRRVILSTQDAQRRRRRALAKGFGAVGSNK